MEQVFSWIVLLVTAGCFLREILRRELPEGRVESFTRHALIVIITWGAWLFYWIVTKVALTFGYDISLSAGILSVMLFIAVSIYFINKIKKERAERVRKDA